jgi:hypothetical protein
MFRKNQTPEKQRERAAKELERVDGMIEGRGGALAIDVKDPLAQKKMRLESEIAAIDEKLAAGPTIQGGPLGEKEFDRQYEAAGGTAAQKFLRAGEDPMKLMNPVAMLGAAFGNTDEQKSLIQRQETAAGAQAVEQQAAAELRQAAPAAAGGHTSSIVVPTVRLLPLDQQPDQLVRDQGPPVVQRMQDSEQPDVAGTSAAALAASAAWRRRSAASAILRRRICSTRPRAATTRPSWRRDWC